MEMEHLFRNVKLINDNKLRANPSKDNVLKSKNMDLMYFSDYNV